MGHRALPSSFAVVAPSTMFTKELTRSETLSQYLVRVRDRVRDGVRVRDAVLLGIHDAQRGALVRRDQVVRHEDEERPQHREEGGRDVHSLESVHALLPGEIVGVVVDRPCLARALIEAAREVADVHAGLRRAVHGELYTRLNCRHNREGCPKELVRETRLRRLANTARK